MDGRCFSNLIAVKADRAGADAIKTPTVGIEVYLSVMEANLA